MTLYINVTQVDKLASSGNLIVEGSKAGLLSTNQIQRNQRFNPPFLVKCAADDILTFRLVKDLQSYEQNQYIGAGILHGPVLTKRYKNQLIGTFVPPPSSSVIRNNNNLLNPNPNTPMTNSGTYNATNLYSPGTQKPYYTETTFRNSALNPPALYKQVRQDPSIINNNVKSIHVLPYQIQLFGFDQKSAGFVYCTISYDRVSYFQGQFCSGVQKTASKKLTKVAMFKGKCPTKNLFSMIDPACEGQQYKFIESIYKDLDGDYQF